MSDEYGYDLVEESGKRVKVIYGRGLQGDPGDRGPAGFDGADGADGAQVELQSTGTHIQWRYADQTPAAAWQNLVAMSTLQAIAGLPSFEDEAELLAATVTVDTILMGGMVLQARVGGPFADSLGKEFGPAWFVTPGIFGAAGDGTTDDAVALQLALNYSGQYKVPCLLEGKEYNCSVSLKYVTDMHVIGGRSVIYPTAWPATGGFFTNVRGTDVPENIVYDYTLEDVTVDGSKIPANVLDGSGFPTKNTNLFGEARGAYRGKYIRCRALNCPLGGGGGTGGGGFGPEQGATDITFIDCYAENCFRGFRAAGFDGTHGDGQSKRTQNIVVRNFTARDCDIGILLHTINQDSADRPITHLRAMSVLIDGFHLYNCGHAPWLATDMTSGLVAQKCGAIVIADAEGCAVRNGFIINDQTYPTAAGGYPATGSNYIGAGLGTSDPNPNYVGAAIMGAARDTVIENVMIEGWFDAIYDCRRPVAAGQIGTVSPTDGDANNNVQGLVLRNIKLVRGSCLFLMNAQSGLDDAQVGIFLDNVALHQAPENQFFMSNLTGFENVRVRMVRNDGSQIDGQLGMLRSKGIDFASMVDQNIRCMRDSWGREYSSLGTRAGFTIDSSANILRWSTDTDADTFAFAFYNSNGGGGLKGSIRTSGAGTTFNTTSDRRLKTDFQAPDPSLLGRIVVYDYAWKSGGRQHGVVAQELYEVYPQAVSVGDTDEEWESKDIGERSPWQVDYSKLVPLLIAGYQALEERVRQLEEQLSAR